MNIFQLLPNELIAKIVTYLDFPGFYKLFLAYSDLIGPFFHDNYIQNKIVSNDQYSYDVIFGEYHNLLLNLMALTNDSTILTQKQCIARRNKMIYQVDDTPYYSIDFIENLDTYKGQSVDLFWEPIYYMCNLRNWGDGPPCINLHNFFNCECKTASTWKHMFRCHKTFDVKPTKRIRHHFIIYLHGDNFLVINPNFTIHLIEINSIGQYKIPEICYKKYPIYHKNTIPETHILTYFIDLLNDHSSFIIQLCKEFSLTYENLYTIVTNILLNKEINQTYNHD